MDKIEFQHHCAPWKYPYGPLEIIHYCPSLEKNLPTPTYRPQGVMVKFWPLPLCSCACCLRAVARLEYQESEYRPEAWAALTANCRFGRCTRLSPFLSWNSIFPALASFRQFCDKHVVFTVSPLHEKKRKTKLVSLLMHCFLLVRQTFSDETRVQGLW